MDGMPGMVLGCGTRAMSVVIVLVVSHARCLVLISPLSYVLSPWWCMSGQLTTAERCFGKKTAITSTVLFDVRLLHTSLSAVRVRCTSVVCNMCIADLTACQTCSMPLRATQRAAIAKGPRMSFSPVPTPEGTKETYWETKAPSRFQFSSQVLQCVRIVCKNENPGCMRIVIHGA